MPEEKERESQDDKEFEEDDSNDDDSEDVQIDETVGAAPVEQRNKGGKLSARDTTLGNKQLDETGHPIDEDTMISRESMVTETTCNTKKLKTETTKDAHPSVQTQN